MLEDLKLKQRDSPFSVPLSPKAEQRPLTIESPQPRYAINWDAIDVEPKGASVVPISKAMLATQTNVVDPLPVMLQATTAPVAIPKPKERPLRGSAALPRRAPIPRWDLDTAKKGSMNDEVGLFYGNSISRLRCT